MKKEDLEKISVFAVIATLFLLIFIFMKPEITGLAVFSPGYYNWTFDNDNYVYDNNLILIENNSARLKIQSQEYNWTTSNSTEFYIISAYYDNENKTSKLVAVDSEKQKIKDNKIVDVSFTNNVRNGDIMNLYLNEEDESDVYLCNISNCNISYGSVHFPDVSGWYNITISNLEEETNNIGVYSYSEVKVNYLKVTREWQEENIGYNLSYPESASLETQIFELPTINQLNLFSKNDETNGQSIKYYYYNENWNEIPTNGSLPELGEVKLKAEFFSNKTETPVLYNMVLSYDFCSEDWECSEWNACQENGAKIRECIDKNECGSFDEKPNEIEGCDYFPGYYEISENKLISIEKDNVTVINASEVVIDLVSNDNIISTNFEIEKNLNLTEADGKKMVSNVNISIEGINERLESGIIRLYYTDEYLAENNIDENSLKLYYYGENWEELNSSVNKEENYVYANVEHFSVYGILGETKSESAPASSSSSGGSSGGHSSGNSVIVNQAMPTEIKEKEIPKKEIIEETNVEENTIEEEPVTSLTGLVIYNAKKAPVSVPIGIGLLILMIIFFLRVAKFNRKK